MHDIVKARTKVRNTISKKSIDKKITHQKAQKSVRRSSGIILTTLGTTVLKSVKRVLDLGACIIATKIS
jgi:hypothetical protein